MTEINKNPLIVGDFNTRLSPIDRSFGQKINWETVKLIDSIDHLTDIHRILYPNTDIKQLITVWWLGQRRNHERNFKNFLELNENETQHKKALGT